ncbi:TPA_asm: UL6 uORF [Human alphaherpesvirus 1]|nr:TPA_asm: UL6 uORF [Human alphaherpesvirus 1]
MLKVRRAGFLSV